MKDKEKSGKNNQILSGHHHQVWLLRQRPTTTKGSQQQQQQNKYVSSWLDWSIDRSIDWLIDSINQFITLYTELIIDKKQN